MDLMDFKPGDRIEYWFTDLDDGRTVRRGTVASVLAGVLGVREDGKDWPDLVPVDDVIRRVVGTR